MYKILVPVDFSKTSVNALKYATRLFDASKLLITVLYIYKTSSSAFHMKSMDRILKEDAERHMQKLVKKLQKEDPDINLIPKVVRGDAVDTIISMGDAPGVDFVVMGTKGASGLKKVFIGSVAGGVISEIKAPVVVVPSNFDYIPVDMIVLAMSQSPISNLDVFAPLRTIATMHKSRVNVVHVSEEEEPDKLEALDLIKDLDPSVTYAIDTGNINARLNNYLQENQVKLLCLVRSRKGFLHRLFNKSVTMEQTFHSPIPLLILHE